MSEASYASSHPVLQTLFDRPVFRTELPNGLTLIHLEDGSSPLVSVQAWVRTGSIHEGDLLGCGLSHYLEHMLFKGTAHRSAQQLTEEIHQFGGYVNAYTTFDRTVYYIDAPSSATERTLEVLQDFVLGAALPREEMEREKDVILREIDMGLDDPDQRVMQGLFGTAFRRHPYQYPIIGYKELFQEVRPEDLEAYYAARYSPSNVVLVVVGDVTTNQVLEWMESNWARVPRRRVSQPLVMDEHSQLSRRELRLEGEVNLFRGVMAWKALGLTDPDTPALDMLASILGSGDSAKLWQEIRDNQELVTDIDASSWTPPDGGLFWVWYNTTAEQGISASAAIQEYLNQVSSNPLSPALLEKAKRKALVSEVNARKTMSGQAGRLGIAEVVAGDLNYPQYYFSRLEKLTPEDLARVGQRIFQEHQLTEVSLSPLAGRSTSPSVKTKVAGALPAFEEVRLSNGVRLLLQEDNRLPKVHFRAALLGGPLYESPTTRGSTQLLSTLLTRDTEKRRAVEVAETIESVGGSFSEFSGNNSFGLGVEVLNQDLNLGLDILTEALLQPAFVPETFSREREAQIAEIEEALDEIVSYGRYHLRERFFGKHPLNRSAKGVIEDLRALKIEHLQTLYDQVMVGPNLVVAVCGDFSRESVISQLESGLGNLSSRSLGPVQHEGVFPAQTGRETLSLPREQAVVFSAFPGPAVIHEDSLAGELLDECLSGMSSRLFQRVREEKGMAYFVSAARTIGLDAGMFYLFAGTHPDQVEAVLEEFEGELQRVREGRWERHELEGCRTRLKVSKISGLQRPGNRALQAALNVHYGLPINDWVDYPKRLDALEDEAVQEFAQKWLRPEQQLELVVRP